MQQARKEDNSILISHRHTAASENDLAYSTSISASDRAYIHKPNSTISQTITQLASYLGSIGVMLQL